MPYLLQVRLRRFLNIMLRYLDFQEGSTREVHLKFPDRRNVFPLILKFIYDGRLDLSKVPESVVPLLGQAEYYGIAELAKQVPSSVLEEMIYLTSKVR